MNRGNGLLDEGPTIPLPEFPMVCKAGDLDGDGSTDLMAVGGRYGMIASILLQRRDGAFQSGGELLLPDTTASVLLGDMDGDAAPEAVFTTNVAYSVARNGGGGRLSVGEFVPLGQQVNADPVLADLDGDGDVDMAVGIRVHCETDWDDPISCERRAARVAVLWNEGGILGQPVLGGEYSNVEFVIAGDIDLDGLQEVIVSASSERTGYSQSVLEAHRHAGGGLLETFGEREASEASRLDAADLDRDGLLDIVAVGRGVVVFRGGLLGRPSADADGDGRPDECAGVRFRRGDWNQDAVLDLTDAIAVLRFLFQEDGEPLCHRAGDTDADGAVNITDPIVILRYLFAGGTAPPEPFLACGKAEGEDLLSCTRFVACE